MAWDVDRDLLLAFDGPGTVPVEREGRCTRGFHNREDLVVSDGMDGRQEVPHRSVAIRAGSLGPIRQGDRITVDGKEAEVRKPLLQDDGTIELLVLA